VQLEFISAATYAHVSVQHCYVPVVPRTPTNDRAAQSRISTHSLTRTCACVRLLTFAPTALLQKRTNSAGPESLHVRTCARVRGPVGLQPLSRIPDVTRAGTPTVVGSSHLSPWAGGPTRARRTCSQVMLAAQAVDAADAALVVVAVAAVVDAAVVAVEVEVAAVKASRPIGNAGNVVRRCLAARQSALNAAGLEVGAAVMEAVAAAMVVQLQLGLLTLWRFQSATAR
jgi:hypothetical protein